MSNPQAQGPQGPKLLQAEDLAKLRCLNDDQKQKYRPVLMNFWRLMDTKPVGSPEHTQARAKLLEWSQKLILQERMFRKRQEQQQGQPQGQGQSSQPTQQNQPPVQPASDQQSPTQPTQQQQQPQPKPQAQLTGGPSAPAPQQQGPPNPQPTNPDILKHVENFPYVIRPGGPAPGTAEAEHLVKEMKNNLMMCLTRQEKASTRIRVASNTIQQRQKSGQEVPPDWVKQLKAAENDYNGSKKYVEEFRKRQQEWKNGGGQPAYAHKQQQPPQQPQAQPQPQPQQSAQAQPQSQPPKPPQNVVKPEPQIKVEGGQPPQRLQQINNMQGGGAPQQQPQQTAQGPSPSVTQQPPRPPPTAHSQQPMPQQNQAAFPQPGQQPHQPPRPQINPQQANAHAQQQSNSPHPQSASSNHAGPLVPLTHQMAVNAAQRSYSNTEGQRTTTPMQSGQGGFHTPANREREQLNNPKMPIPRTLNTTAPVPVGMGQARPTMSGPTNGAPGPMGQPVIQKYPQFQLEGEGDRVLSKRKLDELVRQVTAGSEDALTPEVEDAMLQLADEFVDTVITSACKLSKLRESPQLEIRDLQLVLERNYNIRIPGYASDEVRTVRKLIPAAGWTQKMNAVQAAKVMGGKADI